MEHAFYLKSKKEQNRIQFIISSVFTGINLLVFLLSFSTGFYVLPFLFLSITLSIIAPFFDTPSLKKHGKLVYYSPLFLAEKEKKGIITAHGGTLFDYVFVIDRRLNGNQRTRFIISSYLDGLLNLIESYESRETNTPVKVVGTSYILNERTAQKIGFKKSKTSFLQILLLLFNYVHLTLSHSFSKARLSFPRLSNIQTFQAEMSELLRKKEYIIKLRDRINTPSSQTHALKHSTVRTSP